MKIVFSEHHCDKKEVPKDAPRPHAACNFAAPLSVIFDNRFFTVLWFEIKSDDLLIYIIISIICQSIFIEINI
jgi:hypothetical protein